ncbi:MAG: hypothetical protein PHD06_02910 [Bacteroidales bacterium]|nr:hypothetical protein [Bacteroidales bacterium]MDD4384108.1 hypothetical protein [Bacteroidales bacterium]
MPLRSSYGFLTPQATTRDAAHELGHGKFNLRHTFSPHNPIILDEGSTLNLMDYSTGNELFKYQWDLIHNPEGGWFVFEDEGEGAMVLVDTIEIIKTFIESVRDANMNKQDNIKFQYNGYYDSEEVLLGNGNTYHIRLFKSTSANTIPSEYVNKSEYIEVPFIVPDSVAFEFSTTIGEPDLFVMVDGGNAEKLEKYMFGPFLTDGTILGDPLPNPKITPLPHDSIVW